MKVFDEGLVIRSLYERNKGKHFAILLLVIIATITIDFATKLIFTDKYFSLIDNILSIHFVRNHGGAMGLFLGNYDLLLFIPLGIVVALILNFNFVKHKTYSYTIGMGFLFGGAIGNIADRLFLGSVRDIISIDFLSFVQPVFNMADFFLTVGFFFIAYYSVVVLPGLIYNTERLGVAFYNEMIRRNNKADEKKEIK